MLGLCSCLAGPPHARAAEPAPAVAGPAPVPDVAVEPEMLRLQDALAHEVPHLVPRTAASDTTWIALARAGTTSAEMAIDRPRLLVVVDRNSLVQQLAIVLAKPDGEWQAAGGTDTKVRGR